MLRSRNWELSSTLFLLKTSFIVSSLFLLLDQPTLADPNDIYETQIEGTRNDNYNDAEFRLWLPPNSKNINILLCIIEGSNMTGLHLADDIGWRKEATKLKAGLLAANFNDLNCQSSFDIAEKGSGQALIRAVGSLSKASGRPEIMKLPLVFIGLSVGGQFGYRFASWKPASTRAFITMKGGMHSSEFCSPLLKIPSMWVTANDDALFRQNNIKAVYSMYRSMGAPWTLVKEPNNGHTFDNASQLIAPYLEATLLSEALSPEVNETNNYFPSTDFRKFVYNFENAQATPNPHSLKVSSQPLPDYAYSVPTSLKFTSCNSGEVSQALCIDINRNKLSPNWDRVEIADPDQCWLSSHKMVSSNCTRFILRLKCPTNYGLGVYKNLVRFRFYMNQKQLLGGINIPILINLTGDLSWEPKSIYLGKRDVTKSAVSIITLKSQSNQVLHWQAEQSAIPQGISINAQSNNDKVLILQCTFDPLFSVEPKKGIIVLHVRSNKDWIIRIPYIE